jgi:pimeloyl-ACP methyl ester carboxylesterase
VRPDLKSPALEPKTSKMAVVQGENGPERVQIRVHGSSESPTLIYLPGLHGNWCLVGGFRRAIVNRVRFVEVTYPSTIHWTLDEHAAAVEEQLSGLQISKGWILAESFSSQVAWALIARNRFKIEGLVLAGGFVQHPFRWGARLAQRFCDDISFSVLKSVLFGYARISRFRFRRSPETFAEIQEFVNKLTPRELAAAKHRLHLLAQSDFCSVATEAKIPVYALSGLIDPIVPWALVRRWLKRNCAALREYEIIWNADHNVLGTATRKSAETVWRWMNE